MVLKTQKSLESQPNSQSLVHLTYPRDIKEIPIMQIYIDLKELQKLS